MKIKSIINLHDKIFNRIKTILKMQVGEKIILFNGNNIIYLGKILEIKKKKLKLNYMNQL